MSTHSPQSSGGTIYWSCPPDQFAVFKRGDKALCLTTFGNTDWLVSGGVPQKDVVYVVRDYHYGRCLGSRPGTEYYGQMLHLEGIICDRVMTHPERVEMGWFHAGFRKVDELKVAAIEAARQAQGASL